MLFLHLAILLLFVTRSHARHLFHHLYSSQLLARQDDIYRRSANHQYLLHRQRLGIRSPIPANEPASHVIPPLDAAAVAKDPRLQLLRFRKQLLPSNPPKHNQATAIEQAGLKSDVVSLDLPARPKNPIAQQLLNDANNVDKTKTKLPTVAKEPRPRPDTIPQFATRHRLRTIPGFVDRPGLTTISEESCEKRYCRMGSVAIFHADELLAGTPVSSDGKTLPGISTEPAQPGLVQPQSNANEGDQRKRKGPTASPKIPVPPPAPIPIIYGQPVYRGSVRTPQYRYQQPPQRGGDITRPLSSQTESRRLRLQKQKDDLYKEYTLAKAQLEELSAKPGPFKIPTERVLIRRFIDARSQWIQSRWHKDTIQRTKQCFNTQAEHSDKVIKNLSRRHPIPAIACRSKENQAEGLTKRLQLVKDKENEAAFEMRFVSLEVWVCNMARLRKGSTELRDIEEERSYIPNVEFMAFGDVLIESEQ